MMEVEGRDKKNKEKTKNNPHFGSYIALEWLSVLFKPKSRMPGLT